MALRAESLQMQKLVTGYALDWRNALHLCDDEPAHGLDGVPDNKSEGLRNACCSQALDIVWACVSGDRPAECSD